MLNWDFKKDHVGYAEYKDCNGKMWTLDLYTGNAALIFVYRYHKDKSDWYELHNFFADQEHIKNMLGLKKGYDACISKFDYAFYFFKVDKSLMKVIDLLALYGFPIQIDEILIEYSIARDKDKGVICYDIE